MSKIFVFFLFGGIIEDSASMKCSIIQNRFLLNKSVLICTILSLQILKTSVGRVFVDYLHFSLYMCILHIFGKELLQTGVKQFFFFFKSPHPPTHLGKHSGPRGLDVE